MAIIRFPNHPFFRNPWMDLENMRREMDLLIKNCEDDRRRGGDSSRLFPALNMTEDGQNIYVRAEIPAVDPEGISITVDGDTLTLQGEKNTGAPESCSYHRQEIAVGQFNKAITLPVKVNIDTIEAVASNGILTITLPKLVGNRQKQIKVKVA